MAITNIARGESTTSAITRKAMASVFPFAKTNPFISSFPNHSPSQTPSHTLSESMMEENIENAEIIIRKWRLGSRSPENFTSLFQENRKEAKEILKSVKGLHKAMHFLVSKHPTSKKLVLAKNLMHTAMQRLEKEFHQLLSTDLEYFNHKPVSRVSSELSRSFSTRSNSGDEAEVGSEIQTQMALSDLKLIADSMISSGYGRECARIYTSIRKSVVDEALYRLGIGRCTTSSQVSSMNREALEHLVKKWVDGAEIAIRTLFRGERFMCDHIFSASETIRLTCFSDIIREGSMNMFRFPEAVAKSKRWPEKIVQLMNLYEAISDLYPEVETIFSYEPLSTIRLQALSSLHKLSNSVQIILSEFESSIEKNSSRVLISGGDIHPLTNSVMNYVSMLANYSGVLSDIIAKPVNPAASPFPESYFDSPTTDKEPISAVSIRLAWIILVLLCKLDSKAGLYNDIALSYLFLANNLQFIVDNVHSTNLKVFLGNDWLAKLDKKVKLYAEKYEIVAWNKVFSCLTENLPGEASQQKIEEYVRQFNSAFEETYLKQASCVVTNLGLRNEIKVSIARKLSPLYQEFYSKYSATPSGENLEVLVKFSPDDLGNYLSDLFEGAVVLGSSSVIPSSMSRCLP